MTAKRTTVWETLSKIDVSEHTEKKGNLTYLSWAWAWGTLKDHYPNATFEKHWFKMGEPSYRIPYAMDKQGYAYVLVSVTVDENLITETFPVLDHRNNSVKTPNSFQINTSLQRCLAKAIAYHGLGHYIYAGEDLPAADDKEKPLTDDEEERAAIIEYEAGETKEVAEEKARNQTEQADNWCVGKSLTEWRGDFLDHPEKPVSQSEKGAVMAVPSASEGWQLASKAFAVFMPNIKDFSGPEDCVRGLTEFWKINKDVLAKMSKAEPALHEQVMHNFKTAKKAAQEGKVPELICRV